MDLPVVIRCCIWLVGGSLLRATNARITVSAKSGKNKLALLKTFSDRLKEAIRAADIPKAELASRLGVPPSSVSRWIAGSVPRSETISEIAKLLGVDANWLITGESQSNESSVLREDPTPYRVTPKIEPLRPAGEPTMLERLETLQRLYGETRQELAQANRKLDALIDIIRGDDPNPKPP